MPLARHVSEFVDAAAHRLFNDWLGLEPVTDKVTTHGYELLYAQFLLPLYDSVQAAGERFKMLEIGMGCDMQRGKPGASAMLWSRLLPKADRWQAELDGRCARALGDRLPVNVLVGDQQDRNVVQGWVMTSGGHLHAVIDDGGHTNAQIKTSFDMLWPALRPGGVYIIEDLHASRHTPIGVDAFTVNDMLHAWSEQLLSHRETLPPANTMANRRAQYLARHHPMPRDVAFVFTQRGAAVIGKLSEANAAAVATHRSFPDVGGGPLQLRERVALRSMADRYRKETERAAVRDDNDWCLVLTASTNVAVDLRTQSYGKAQQRDARERQQMYADVLQHWLRAYPKKRVTLVENTLDNLTWAAPTPNLELIKLLPARTCGYTEIGCHEASALLRGLERSRFLFSRRGVPRCTYILKVTGRYAVTSDVDAALRGCAPGWDVALQNSTWGAIRGTMVLGFRSALVAELFRWSRHGGACMECQIDSWLRKNPGTQVCFLPPLSVKPTREGSTGLKRTVVRL
jgi:hypothetical protein